MGRHGRTVFFSTSTSLTTALINLNFLLFCCFISQDSPLHHKRVETLYTYQLIVEIPALLTTI
jgi:hypothetical protein